MTVFAPSRRPSPPPPSGLPDELSRTACQVRIPGGYTHRLATAVTGRLGRVYTSDCDKTYYGMDGAVLTTAPVTCPRCGGAE